MAGSSPSTWNSLIPYPGWRALYHLPVLALLQILVLLVGCSSVAASRRGSPPGGAQSDDPHHKGQGEHPTVPPLTELMALSLPEGVVDDVDGEDVIVNTNYGPVLGKRRTESLDVGGETTMVDWFLGIPYASPPIEERRFAAPRPPDQWKKTRRAVRFGSVCPQTADYFYTQSVFQSEDCLYLNVYVPYDPVRSAQELYPVMVFIHGGSYSIGGSSIYYGQYLAQYGVVVVTFNYRLGLLGFFTTSDGAMPGNYGLLDQIEALKWVRGNIRRFRGDPDRVTIFGNSAGGSSVGLLTLCPLAKGLFHYAIAQSGAPTAFWAVLEERLELRSHAFNVGKVYGCKNVGNSSEELAKCMRTVRFSEILERYGSGELPSITPSRTDFKPHVDGYVLPRSIKDMLKNGPVNNVIFMTGTVKDEWTRNLGWFLDDLFESSPHHDVNFQDGLDRHTFEAGIHHVVTKRFGWPEDVAAVIIHQYTNWTKKDDPIENRQQYIHFFTDFSMVAPSVFAATHLHKHLLPVYVYTFNHHSANTDPQWWGSFHSVELNYLFGSPFTGIKVDDGGHQLYTEADRNVSRLMMVLWSNFARTGNPTPTPVLGDVVWHQFVPKTLDYLYIGTNDTRMRRHLRPEQMAFWNILMQNLLARQRGNPKNSSSYWAEMTALAVICTGLGALLLLALGYLCLRKRHSGEREYLNSTQLRDPEVMVPEAKTENKSNLIQPQGDEELRGKSNGEPVTVRL